MNRQKPLSRWFVLGACLFGALLGLLEVAAWAADSAPLRSIAGGPMEPTVGAGLFVVSVSTWLSCRNGRRPGGLARSLAAAAVALGLLPIAGRSFEWLLGGTRLAPESSVLSELPRSTLSAALSLCLLGLSLLALDRRWILARLGALFGPLAVGFIALTMFRGASADESGASSVNMPPGAGIAFALLALAIILSRAEATGALRGPWPARYALMLGLAGTLGARRLAKSATHETATRQFQGDVSFAAQAVHRRVERYVSILHSTRALLASHPELTRAQFRDYVSELDLPETYPGLRALAFCVLLSPNEVPAHLERVRKEGLPELAIWQKGRLSEYVSLVFAEPLNTQTLPALSYDVRSEAIRREAMDRARDTGTVAISGGVYTFQNTKEPGFLIYVPIYRGREPATVAQRRERILGYAVGLLQAKALFAETLTPELRRRISLTILDGASLPGRLLYRDLPPHELPSKPSYVADRTLDIAGQRWKLGFVALRGFEADTASSAPHYVFGAGLLVSLLAFLALRTQIRAREQAEESVATRDMFISVASHELKTPLTPLRLNAQAIVESAAGETLDRDSLLARARGIERSSKKLESMIDRLLDVSRLSLGRLQLNLEPVELGELLRSVIADMQAEIVTSGSTVELSVRGPVVANWDRFRLEQVVTNLLRNSLKFGRRQPIRVELEALERAAVLRIRDQGIGIAKTDLARIFLRFERAVSEQHYGGFGLGLWIAQQIVDRHGGVIDVDSTVGKGSTFTVTLPFTVPE